MRSSLEKGEEYTLYTKEGCAVSFSHWRDGVWLIATGISCDAVFAEDMARVLDMLEEDDDAK